MSLNIGSVIRGKSVSVSATSISLRHTNIRSIFSVNTTVKSITRLSRTSIFPPVPHIYLFIFFFPSLHFYYVDFNSRIKNSSKFIIGYDKPQDELYSPLFIGDAILKSGRVLFEVKAGYSIISARMYRDGGRGTGEGGEGGGHGMRICTFLT